MILADGLTETQAIKIESELMSVFCYRGYWWITNSEVAEALELQSDYLRGSKDYVASSLLGLLMKERKMKRADHRKRIAQV